MDRAKAFPLGAAVTRAELETDPHPLLARLRRSEPVSWLPALGGWLVTSRDLASAVLRDSVTYTVDDPRFTTALVIGPSMLSLDGDAHARHRAPFNPAFSRSAVRDRLAEAVASHADRLVRLLRPRGTADLRTGLARPLAVAVIRDLLGLPDVAPEDLLSWYDDIVGAVSALAGTEGEPSAVVRAGEEAFGVLSGHLARVLSSGGPSPLAGTGVDAGGLTAEEAVSNAAVIMFGGIETTEGMITTVLYHLLSHPDQLQLVMHEPALIPNAVEESMRLEPAAALLDRYATRDGALGAATISRGELVSVSLAGAGRDPAVFTDPDRFDVRRPNSRLALTFARGPHFCIGVHLARLEAVSAVRAALRSLPALRLDPSRASAPHGLVFRKPPSLLACWEPA